MTSSGSTSVGFGSAGFGSVRLSGESGFLAGEALGEVGAGVAAFGFSGVSGLVIRVVVGDAGGGLVTRRAAAGDAGGDLVDMMWEGLLAQGSPTSQIRFRDDVVCLYPALITGLGPPDIPQAMCTILPRFTR